VPFVTGLPFNNALDIRKAVISDIFFLYTKLAVLCEENWLTTLFQVCDIPLPTHAETEPANVSYIMYSFQETFAFEISPLCKYYLCH